MTLACRDPFPFTWHLTLKEVADHDALDRELQATGMLRDGKAARYASLHGRKFSLLAMNRRTRREQPHRG